MKYVNGNDLPFEIKQALKGVLDTGEALILTTIDGELVVMPMNEYTRLQNGAAGKSDEIESSDYSRYGDEYEYLIRDEVDY